jgi:ABC-type sulfate/molybdate transport systems ATPase subunit
VSLEVSLRSEVGGFPLQVAFHAGGGITALFGPSGAGKTLTRRHVAGLERAREGRIVLDGRVLFDGASGRNLSPQARRIGYVFQEYALFPHLDVAGNVGFALADRPRGRREARVEAVLEMVDLAGFGRRRVRGLSGGERQRVALARALAPEPPLLLLDEPFAALDFRVRRTLRGSLRTLQERTGVPMVLVTHSLAEVRELADHLVLIDRGRVVAEGPTAAIHAEPRSSEVAELLAEELG